jgi:hypothetical protein
LVIVAEPLSLVWYSQPSSSPKNVLARSTPVVASSFQHRAPTSLTSVAPMRARLPQRHDGADRVADGGHPAGAGHVEGRAEDRGAAELGGARRGRVGVLDRDVGRPVRRRPRRAGLRGLPVEDRDVLAVCRKIVYAPASPADSASASQPNNRV